MKLLVEKKTDLNHADKDGDTVLHFSVMTCCPRATRLFVEHGADASKKNNRGHTALDIIRVTGARAMPEGKELFDVLKPEGGEDGGNSLPADFLARLIAAIATAQTVFHSSSASSSSGAATQSSSSSSPQADSSSTTDAKASSAPSQKSSPRDRRE